MFKAAGLARATNAVRNIVPTQELEETMPSLKVMAYLSAMALVSATSAYAADPAQDPNNPNCSPGVKGCSSNYATSDQSNANPTKTSTAGTPIPPNCSPGQVGCSANYATTDHSDDNPNKANMPTH
jgi:hypothetical protein